MTDLEQTARDVAEECFEKCIGWMKSGYPGGMADPQRAKELEGTMARVSTVSSLLCQADGLEELAAAIRSQGVK